MAVTKTKKTETKLKKVGVNHDQPVIKESWGQS